MRSGQAGTGVGGLADGFRRGVALAARRGIEVGPQGTFGHAVFVGKADVRVRKQKDLSNDVFITAAVGDGVLRDADRGIKDRVSEVGFEVRQKPASVS